MTARRRTTKTKATEGTGSEVDIVASGQASAAPQRTTGEASTRKRKALDDIPETEAASSPKKRKKRKSIGQQTLKRKPRAPLKPKNPTELPNITLPAGAFEAVDTKNVDAAAEEQHAIGESAKTERPTTNAERTRRTATSRKPPGRKPKVNLQSKQKTKQLSTGQETLENDVELPDPAQEPAKVESPTEITAPAEVETEPKPRKRKRKAVVQSPRKRKKPTSKEPDNGPEEITEAAVAETLQEPAIIPTIASTLSDRKGNKRGRKPKSVPDGVTDPPGDLLNISNTIAKAELLKSQQSRLGNQLLPAIDQTTAAASDDKKGKKRGRKPRSVHDQQAGPLVEIIVPSAAVAEVELALAGQSEVEKKQPSAGSATAATHIETKNRGRGRNPKAKSNEQAEYSGEIIDPSPAVAEVEQAQAEKSQPENEQLATVSTKAALPIDQKGKTRGRKPKTTLINQPESSKETIDASPTNAEAESVQANQSRAGNKRPAIDATNATVSIESKGKKRGRRPKLIPNQEPELPEGLIDPFTAAAAESAQTELPAAEKEHPQPIEDPVPSKRKGRKRKSIGQIQRPRKKPVATPAPDIHPDTETTHLQVKPVDAPPETTIEPVPKRKGRPKKLPVPLPETEDAPIEHAVSGNPQPAVATKKRGRPKQAMPTAIEAKPEDTSQESTKSADIAKRPKKQQSRNTIEPAPSSGPEPLVEKPYAPTAFLGREPHLSPPVKKRGRPKKQAPAGPEVTAANAIPDRPKAQPKRRIPKAPSTGTTKVPASALDPATHTLNRPAVHGIEDHGDDTPSDHQVPSRPRKKPNKLKKPKSKNAKPLSNTNEAIPNDDDDPPQQARLPSRNTSPSPQQHHHHHHRSPLNPATRTDPTTSSNHALPSSKDDDDLLQARLASLSASVKKRKAEMGAKMIDAPPPAAASGPTSRSEAATRKPSRGLEG
ncbi:MAG: hypothetical protein LQ346_008203, partial [Caloplaca aetnensis]